MTRSDISAVFVGIKSREGIHSMAKKRYINTVFWDDAYVSNLDPSEKLLFIYLITNPCTNISGVYQISLKRVSLDTGIEKEMVSKIFERFQKDNKILYFDGWMAIKNFIKHQNINSPLIVKGIEKELTNTPLECLSFIDASIYGIDTVSNKHISKGQGKGQCQGSNTFKKPTPQEVQQYLDSKNCKYFTGQYFCDKNDSIGWLVGRNKTPMKDWEAAVRTWIRNHEESEKKQMPKASWE
jgi:hypothetical protein